MTQFADQKAQDQQEREAANALLEACRARGLSLATAESCTGGGVGGAITAIAGSSDVFQGGIISYSNAVKQGVLGVPASVLKTVGAVSEECAKAMAEGASRVLNAGAAVSITGIAGPGGGSTQKPVGLVIFGFVTELGGEATTSVQHFSGNRDEVRAQSRLFALTELRSRLVR